MKSSLNGWKGLKVLAMACVMGFVSAQGMAQETKPVNETIKEAIASAFEVEVTAVEATPYAGIYEVQMGANIVYTTEKADFVIAGNLIDAKTHADVTSERVAKLQEIPFDTLPLEHAVKRVIGKGERQMAVFEDPNCGYCKKLYKELEKVDNVTVYSFLMPILSPDSTTKARNIWCASNQAEVWGKWMGEGVVPAAASCEETPLQSNLALAKKLNIQGTPAMFFGNGMRINGYMPGENISKVLDQQDVKVSQN